MDTKKETGIQSLKVGLKYRPISLLPFANCHDAIWKIFLKLNCLIFGWIHFRQSGLQPFNIHHICRMDL